MNTKVKLFISAFSVIAFATVVSSCKSTKSTAIAPAPAPAKQTDCATAPTYAADIKPILDAACASSCHSAKRKAKRIDLSSLEGVKAIATSPSFLGAIRHESDYVPMPRMNPKLEDASINKIACWIKEGMN